jgi:hypothetical protein
MHASTASGRLLAALLAAAAVLVAGCSTSSPSAGPAIKMSPPASSAASATSSPAATSAGPGPCKASALSVLLGHARKAAGKADYPIEFINISSTSCTLYGFPRVSFATGSNYSIAVGPAAAHNHASTKHLITVPPEGTARALVGVLNARNFPSGCRETTVTAIVVRMPSFTTSVHLPFNGVTCVNHKDHVLTVNAMMQGAPDTAGGSD